MYKLIDILKEVKEDIKFTQPNFEQEWNEAKRYPDLFPDKEAWLKAVKFGQVEDVDCSMSIENTDMCDGDLDDLEPEKVARAMQALKSGVVELPIVVNNNGRYELVGGNTRLTALATHGLPTKAWVINLRLLSEGKQVGTLYHFTNYDSAIGIVMKDFKLKVALTPKEVSIDELPDYAKYISFTRNKNLDSPTISREVRFTIDGNALSNRYRVEPFADIKAGFGRTRPGKDEAEERVNVAKREGFVDIAPFLVSIDVMEPKELKVGSLDADAFTELVDDLKYKNIPYKIVNKF